MPTLSLHNLIILGVIIGGFVLLWAISEMGNTRAVSKSQKRVNDGRSKFTTVSGKNTRSGKLAKPHYGARQKSRPRHARRK